MTENSLDPRDQTVTVRGEAAVRTAPDEAFVFVTLEKTEGIPGPALADVAARAARLSQLLDEIGINVQDRSTTGMTVEERFEHTGSGRRSVGHRAASTVSVRFCEMQSIGDLIMRSSQELHARIDGPNWRVSLDHPVRLQAASQAAANALRKASAYAAGIEMRVDAIREMKEPERAFGSLRAAAASGKSDVPIETGEQEIVAVIEATFTLVAGAD